MRQALLTLNVALSGKIEASRDHKRLWCVLVRVGDRVRIRHDMECRGNC